MASPRRADRPRPLGLALEGPGFYVWEEEPGRAVAWARELGRSHPHGPDARARARPARPRPPTEPPPG
jgi:hypothetical protein